MEQWFILALISVFAIAGSEISQKISLTHKANISAVTNNFVVWTLQGIGGLLLAISFHQLNTSLSLNDYLRLFAVAVAYFFGGTFFYTSYKSNSPSISIILGSVSIVISTSLGIILFRENSSFQKFIGIAIILISIIIVNYTKKERINKYNFFAFLGGAFYGLAYTLDKSNVLRTNPTIYVALMSFSVAIISLIIRPFHIIKEVKKLKKTNYYSMFSAAFFGTLFNLFTFLSYSKGGNVGIVDAMNNSSIFLIIFLEILILKDRSKLKKKIVCAVFILLGIILLSQVH